MRKIGIVLLIVGILGLIFFGIDAYQQSESFSVVGVDIAVSKANWTPVIFSGIVGILGLLLMVFSKRK
ncbi:transglycosylase [Marinilabilia rubra]|uniref:Transglycosylase n=1 Tax=Marinilabilia rubra TaxID=2162893 RepID=A0A2U2B3F8_9BACT|nr:transglycosylase [Marinilabilia rubra]PWD97567.1 transglycosylase [Marinilabilia rubra]